MSEERIKWHERLIDDNATTALRLSELRDGMSVAAFARKCGLGDSLMRKYLAGAIPRLDNAKRIADACGVSLNWLAGGAA